jgi:hypothetical protein
MDQGQIDKEREHLPARCRPWLKLECSTAAPAVPHQSIELNDPSTSSEKKI